ncbi:hypothetical protein [Streptomyces sp. ODS28]|uniref:hypothetical protein n=1 Tax=Streptomyces sp. ODS28 TaxID=3136688 RepID=UPI0031EF2E08
MAPDSICLQQGSDFPLDDIVALSCKGPYKVTLERQVKRTFEIFPSSEPWRKTIRQCLQSLDSFGDEIDADRHRLGITSSGPLRTLEALRSLAAYAASQKSLKGFLKKISTCGQELRRIWRHLVETVRDLLADRGVIAIERELVNFTAFRVARRLVVEVEPTEQISPRRTYLCALLEDRVLAGNSKINAAAVYRMIEEAVQEWGPRAGVIDAEMLRNRLRVRGVALRGDPPGSDSRSASSPRTKLIRELDPADALRLEVHPSFEVDRGSAGITVLPPYITRTVSIDGELRRQVAQAADGSRLVMVIGGSSTGKTRACWEAVRSELPNWRIVHPLAPNRPVALLRALESDVLCPRTVLWLNDANMYLQNKEYVAEISASIQELLADEQRGPVLVLGTIWPDIWDNLSGGAPEDNYLDIGMGAVEQLADLAVTVRMPIRFTQQELAHAATLFDSDERLRLARSRAVSGHITQFLAGALHLWRRYEQSEGAARAILHAAMDARRFGHGPHLSGEFLQAAAEGYVDEATWHTLNDDWFTFHLTRLLKSRRQLPGPLTRFRPRSGQPLSATTLYQLADFLDEKGRAIREGEIPPSSFWVAATAHSYTESDLRELAQAARHHKVMDCEELYFKAAASGDSTVLRWFARRLIAMRKFKQAEEVIDTKCLDGFLLGELSAAVGHAGRIGDAERLARRAYQVSGNRMGARALAHHLQAMGMNRAAERIYSWAADTGDPVAARWLTAHHEAGRNRGAAEELAHAFLVQHGSPAAALELAQLRAAVGKAKDVEWLSRLVAEHGHAEILVTCARERAERRDLATALCFYRAAAEAGNPAALQWMSWHSEGQDDRRRAEDFAYAAAAVGNSHALHGLAHLRSCKGYFHDAERLNRSAAQAGSAQAKAWLTRKGFFM